MFKKRRMIVMISAVLMVLFVVSCAEQQYDPSENFQRESFEAWVKKHDPLAEKMPSGVYIRFVERDASWDKLAAPILFTSWLSINYTGRSLDRNVFESRDVSLAQLVGYWNITTHFVNDYVIYNQSQTLCSGLVDALSYMRKGDSARVYIPSSHAYNSTMSVNAGYSASGAVYVNYPIYFDIRLADIVENPYDKELEDLKLRAVELGYDLKRDSVDKGLYVRIIDHKPLGDTITKDSTVKVRYSNYFFDGKLVTTNLDSIAKIAGYYKSGESYMLKELTPANFHSINGTYLVYPKMVLKMRKGETAEAIAASWWGPGMQGELSSKPQLLPYQSLRYVVKVIDPSVAKVD